MLHRTLFFRATLAGILSLAPFLPAPVSAQEFVLGVRTDHAVSLYPRGVALGDVNADGRLDLAVVHFTSRTVAVLLGDGLGGFTSRTMSCGSRRARACG